MTEKRFTTKIFEEETYPTTEFFDNGEMMNDEEIVKLLNEQHEQIVQLKRRIQLLSPLLDLADAIIDLSDDDKSKVFWEKRNKEVEQKWEEIIRNSDDVND